MIEMGCALQRLFSTFPNGWPGRGLLLLRLGVGVALVYLGACGLLGTPGDAIADIRNLIEAAGGLFVIAGLWTPAAGAVIALDELWIALSVYSAPREGHWTHIFLAVLAAGLAMLGPGAWSVDAHLFGRKRFDFGERTRGK
jgi:putative oxidoreductase